MMYESPILITQVCDKIATELVEQEEAYVFSVVKRIYVDVNRDELIKALAYDRGQYEKGYSDGRAARDAEIVRCKDCRFYNEGEMMCNDTNGFDRWWKPDDFCSYGERRTDDANKTD